MLAKVVLAKVVLPKVVLAKAVLEQAVLAKALFRRCTRAVAAPMATAVTLWRCWWRRWPWPSAGLWPLWSGAGEGGAGECALWNVRARRGSAYGHSSHDAVVLVEAVAIMAIPLARPSLGQFSCQVSSTCPYLGDDRSP